MHLFAVGWLSDLWRVGGKRDGRIRTFLESIIRDHLILGGGVSDPKINNMLGFGGVINTSRRAEKVAGGYLVNGVGKFSTMCAAADFLFETARYEDPESGPVILNFYLPAKTSGIKLASTYGRYGYRRVTALLRIDGWQVNRKRVQRIWRREGLKVPAKQAKSGRLWLNDGSCIRLRPQYPNHVWAYDFVADRTVDGRPLKMLTIIDEFSRQSLAIPVAPGSTRMTYWQL